MRPNPAASSATLAPLMLIILFALSGLAIAEVPHLLNYQGRLTDSLGAPLDTTVTMQFYIFSDSTSGTQLWTESHGSVVVDRGLFEVLLGSVTPIPAGVFNGNDRWLALAVEKDPAGEPRTRIVSSAYAYHAGHADTADYALSAPGTGGAGGWVDTGTRVRLETAGDSVGIGTSTPSERLHLQGNFMLSNDYDIKFGTTGSQIDQVSTDLVIDVADDLHLQPADNIYIRQGTDPTFMMIDPGSKNMGIGTTAPEDMVHIDNNASGGSAFLRVETSHATNWHEAGIRIETPQNRWHLRMDDDSNNQISDGALGLRSQDAGMEVMTWNENGRVGIGTTNPLEKLHVNGNEYVVGDIAATGRLDVSGNAEVGGDLDVFGSLTVDDTIFASSIQADLPYNSVNSDHILDDPGLASNYGWSLINVSSTWQTIISESITVPAAGKVIVLVSANTEANHDISGYTSLRCGIVTNTDSVPLLQQYVYFTGQFADEGPYRIPLNVHRTFNVSSAGTYTYYFLAYDAGDNDNYIYRRDMTLLYVPESYESGTAASPEAPTPSPGIAASFADVGDPNLHQVLLDEINALKRRIEALEGR